LEETSSSRFQTVESPRDGTSTNNHLPLNQESTTILGRLRATENHQICGLQAPTQNGGRSSDSKDNTSSTSKTRRQLMSSRIRMLKDKRLLSGRDTMDSTKDGELSILTRRVRAQPRVTTKTSDSTLVDHSTSDQDSE
jgi:hypothetical protein